MQEPCCHSLSGQKGLWWGQIPQCQPAQPAACFLLCAGSRCFACLETTLRWGTRILIGFNHWLEWFQIFCTSPIFISSPMAFWTHLLGSKFIRAGMWLLQDSYLFQTRTKFTFASSGQWSYIPKSQGIRTEIAPVACSLCSTLNKDKTYKRSQVKLLECMTYLKSCTDGLMF